MRVLGVRPEAPGRTWRVRPPEGRWPYVVQGWKARVISSRGPSTCAPGPRPRHKRSHGGVLLRASFVHVPAPPSVPRRVGSTKEMREWLQPIPAK
jgi:hypothetical protein